ncbi:hypothetical protein HK104_006608 [Borealophlyctis nickersoniae]|nr:hypothetical protein HK104_006608 [Borealophlyctis nickersoniae]
MNPHRHTVVTHDRALFLRRQPSAASVTAPNARGHRRAATSPYPTSYAQVTPRESVPVTQFLNVPPKSNLTQQNEPTFFWSAMNEGTTLPSQTRNKAEYNAAPNFTVSGEDVPESVMERLSKLRQTITANAQISRMVSESTLAIEGPATMTPTFSQRQNTFQYDPTARPLATSISIAQHRSSDSSQQRSSTPQRPMFTSDNTKSIRAFSSNPQMNRVSQQQAVGSGPPVLVSGTLTRSGTGPILGRSSSAQRTPSAVQFESPSFAPRPQTIETASGQPVHSILRDNSQPYSNFGLEPSNSIVTPGLSTNIETSKLHQYSSTFPQEGSFRNSAVELSRHVSHTEPPLPSTDERRQLYERLTAATRLISDLQHETAIQKSHLTHLPTLQSQLQLAEQTIQDLLNSTHARQQEWETELAALKESISDLTASKRIKEDKWAVVGARLEETEVALAAAETERDKLVEEVGVLKRASAKDIAALTVQLESGDARIKELEEEVFRLRKASGDVSQLARECEACKNELRNAEAHIRAAEEDNGKLQKECQSLRDQARQSEEQCRVLKTKIESLQGEIGTLKVKQSTVDAAAQRGMEKMVDKVKYLEERLLDEERISETLRERIKFMEGELDKARSNAEKARADRDVMERKLQDKSGEARKLLSDLITEQQKLRLVQRELEDMKVKDETDLMEQCNLVNELRAQLKAAQKECTDAELKRALENTDLAEKHSREIAEQTKLINDLRTQLKLAHTESTDARIEVETMKTKLPQHNWEINARSDLVNELKLELGRMDQRLAEARDRTDVVRLRMMDERNQDLIQHNKVLETLDQQLKFQEKENSDLLHKIQVLEANLAEERNKTRLLGGKLMLARQSAQSSQRAAAALRQQQAATWVAPAVEGTSSTLLEENRRLTAEIIQLKGLMDILRESHAEKVQFYQSEIAARDSVLNTMSGCPHKEEIEKLKKVREQQEQTTEQLRKMQRVVQDSQHRLDRMGHLTDKYKDKLDWVWNPPPPGQRVGQEAEEEAEKGTGKKSGKRSRAKAGKKAVRESGTETRDHMGEGSPERGREEGDMKSETKEETIKVAGTDGLEGSDKGAGDGTMEGSRENKRGYVGGRHVSFVDCK